MEERLKKAKADDIVARACCMAAALVISVPCAVAASAAVLWMVRPVVGSPGVGMPGEARPNSWLFALAFASGMAAKWLTDPELPWWLAAIACALCTRAFGTKVLVLDKGGDEA